MSIFLTGTESSTDETSSDSFVIGHENTKDHRHLLQTKPLIVKNKKAVSMQRKVRELRANEVDIPNLEIVKQPCDVVCVSEHWLHVSDVSSGVILGFAIASHSCSLVHGSESFF